MKLLEIEKNDYFILIYIENKYRNGTKIFTQGF